MSSAPQPLALRAWAAIRGGSASLRDMAGRPQVFGLRIYSFLAMLSLAIFGVLHMYVEQDFSLGFIELAGSLAVVLNAVVLRLTRDVIFATNMFLLIVMVFLTIMLISGGTQGTGAFWFFVFPVSAFFLAGKKAGLYWMIGLAAACICLLWLSSTGALTLAYSPVEIRQLLISVGVVSIGIYAYQEARERAEVHIRSEQDKLDRAKNEFLALVSHQLRTPISAIAWLSELLIHGDAGRLDAEQQQYIEQIYDSNKRSIAIVDAIITVADLQVQHIHVQLEPVDMPELCHAVVQEMQHTHPTEGVTITEHYATDVEKLRCDPSLARTILRNIISNAMKYTPQGGTINISISRSKKALSAKSRGSLCVSVADTGYGIPKKQQQNVFAKLFRASNIKDKDTDGTGLGLYIVKAILDQVGGSVHFESEEGKGSTFVVSLPLEGMQQSKGRSHA